MGPARGWAAMARAAAHAILLCLVLAAAAAVAPSGDATRAGAVLPSLHSMLEHCSQLEDLYQSIHDGMAPWRSTGIERHLMARAIAKFTTRGGNKGIALAFRNGTAYVVEANLKVPVGHHASAFFAYMQVMLELQQMFGSLIPDVEFVIATSDRPAVLLSSPGPNVPVFRFCSSDVHADIQVPIFHFTTKRYTQMMLQAIPELNSRYPWESKKEILFGRFAHYMRFIDPGELSLQRMGANNTVICKVETNTTAVCQVRQHMFVWSKEYPRLMNVKSGPRLAMHRHGQYKYLVHLDGQALSSRMDLLLPLNSLIFKEESGYKSFYHHLLKPMVHYLPFWLKGPEDVLEALEWAKGHDAEAKRIAARAQAFALRYLDKKARTCYWYKLLTEFSKLLRYQVSPEHEVEEEGGRQQEAQRKAQKKAAKQKAGRQPASAGRPESKPSNRAKPLSTVPEGAYGEIGRWQTVEEYLRTVPANYETGRWWVWANKSEVF